MRACATGTGSLNSIKTRESIGFGPSGIEHVKLKVAEGKCKLIFWWMYQLGVDEVDHSHNGREPDAEGLPPCPAGQTPAEPRPWTMAPVTELGFARLRRFRRSIRLTPRNTPTLKGFQGGNRCTKCQNGMTCHCHRDYQRGNFWAELCHIPTSEFQPTDRACNVRVRRPFRNACCRFQRTARRHQEHPARLQPPPRLHGHVRIECAASDVHPRALRRGQACAV